VLRSSRRPALRPALSSLIGIIDNPSLALFAGRSFPCALSDRHCVTLCFTRHWIKMP
jgi:hypothetical protein